MSHEHLGTERDGGPQKYDPELFARQLAYSLPVTLGCKYMDITYTGWEAHVSIDELDVQDALKNPLSYATRRRFSLTDEFGKWSLDALIAHGFMLPPNYELRYPVLNREWKERILLRVKGR